jgi:hypothetical protein
LTSNLLVQSASTLSGSGTIYGGVDDFGTVAPAAGNTAGLTVQGGSAVPTQVLTFESGSTLQLSLANSQGSNQPLVTDYSKLTLGAGVAANLGGTLVTLDTDPINRTDLFTIIVGNTSASPSTITGMFVNADTTHVSGSTYDFGTNGYINYAFNPATWAALPANQQNLANFETITGGNSVALYSVPEPSSLGMLLASLGVALGLQRFRRRRS